MMIQKTTELGVQKFFPLLCERSVVREINIERAEKIVTEASEQSNRISVPEILKIQNFADFELFICFFLFSAILQRACRRRALFRKFLRFWWRKSDSPCQETLIRQPPRVFTDFSKFSKSNRALGGLLGGLLGFRFEKRNISAFPGKTLSLYLI